MRKLVTPLLLCAAFAAVSLPTLHWYQFNNSIENLVVETALETRRDGHWLIPRLLDQPRTRKPPLAAWATAAATRSQTVAELSDPSSRESAYARLAREVRLPALIAACLTLVGAVMLGRVIGDASVGLATGVITATTLLFLRESRLATPDAYLAAWVTWCNVFLARAIVRGEHWRGCCGAGICLGLAMMTKGPVALIQTVAPVLGFLAWSRLTNNTKPVRPLQRSPLLPILAGITLFLWVAVPWHALMLAKLPGVWHTWLGEVTRADPADPRPDPWYVNAQIFRFFMPWTVWLSVGAIAAVVSICRRERGRVELAMWLVLVPLVVMSFFVERKPRYILPVIPAAAVLAAWPLVHVMRGAGAAWLRHVYVVLHWGCVLAIPIAGIFLAAYEWHMLDGTPWVSRTVGVGLASALAVLIVVALLLGRRLRESPMLIVTALAMLAFDVVYIHGNSRDARGQSEMKPLADVIAARAPDAKVFSFFPSEPDHNAPLDLSIYLNRVVRPMNARERFGSVGRDEDVVVVIGTRTKPGNSERIPTPEGSEYLGSSRRSGVTWHALLISSAGARE